MPIVERSRLFELLNAAIKCRLTVLDASAGAGKTVLLSSWVEWSRHSAVTWVRLESSDNDHQTFWSYLQKAVKQGHQAPSPATAGTFLQTISVHKEPLLLVLDRAQKLHDATLLAELEQVLLRSPSGFRVVMAGRGGPVWPFPLLRSRSELAQIGYTELAFTLAEAMEFFELAGLNLSPSEVATVLEQTKGWASELELIAQGRQSGGSPALVHGSGRATDHR